MTVHYWKENASEPLKGEFEVEAGDGGVKGGKTTFSLYFAAISASLLAFGMGTVVVWTSPVVSKLRSHDTDLNPLGRPITTFEESILGSISLFGGCLGSLLLTKLCDYIGRRKLLLILAAFMFFADVVLAFATHLLVYYVSRFVLSVCMGAGSTTLAIFLSEITEDHNRGRIGTVIGLASPMGSLYVYLIGSVFSVRDFTLLCAVPYAILIFNLVFFVPESPVYLASKGERWAALRSLDKLRSKPPGEIDKEYEEIMHTWNQSTKEHVFREFFANRGLKKGLVIAVIVNVIQQLTGVVAILAYAGPLFDSADMKISGNTTAIFIGCIKVCTVFLTMVIIERVGKRRLLLVSTLGAGVSHFVLGLFFYCKSTGTTWIADLLWLPVLSILMFFVFYSIGIGAIVPSLTSELFPSNVKAVPVALANFVNYGFGVVITSIFPVFIHSLGPTWCLWGFSLSCMLGFAFIYFIFPEIKGKSVLEIVEILSK